MMVLRSLRLTTLTLLALCAAAPAQARSYYLNQIEVAAAVRPDGSMHVREIREVVFRGVYHAFDRAIPLPHGTQLENLSVSERGVAYREDTSEAPGTYTTRRTGREVRLSWFYLAADETRRFVLEYDVLGAVEKHADVAELYWQFIEPDHDWEARRSRVSVLLPSAVPESELLVWPHGALWGKKEVQRDRIALTCNPLPADTMVEARIVFPTAVINSSPRQDQRAVLAQVVAEEEEWMAEANRLRRRAKARLILLWALPAAFIIVGVSTWLVLYFRYGREHREANPPEYVREPPGDWTPNEVAFLWRWGQISAQDMTATLMDLVRRGALRLVVTTATRPVLGGLLGEKADEDFVVERLRDYEGELSQSEQYLISQILFHDVTGDSVSLEAFQKSARSRPSASQRRFKTWKKLAKVEAKRKTVIDPVSKKAAGAMAAVGAIILIASLACAALLESPTFVPSALAGIALAGGGYAILRRTPEAARDLTQWQAFRRYLTDFSQLHQYPAPAVVLWEHYLVYAITLGVADRVIEQFQELYPQVADSATRAQAFPHWVGSGGSPLSGMSSIGSVLSSFSSTLATATSAMSTSSGSSGGFSGGGGGGGGGGSSGAR
jgi:uncharacterized membrane protein